MATGPSSLPVDSRALADLPYEDDRTAMTKEAFKHAFLANLFYVQGKFPALAKIGRAHV